MMDFEDIRPFNDNEYSEVIEDLMKVEPLMNAVQFYMPEHNLDEIKAILRSFTSIHHFQSNMACRMVQGIIDHSMVSFSYEGVLDLDKGTSYMLMSNHRDIVLDSALVNYCLNDREYNTCEIAIGSNLLAEPWIKKLVRLNKSFIVKRNIPKQEMLEASKTLSAYIQHALFNKEQSVWIAQREGRAKDGDDKTNPGLLKMFGLSSEKDLLEYLISLNITPISISYELDPCDYLKIPELLSKTEGKVYEKKPGEDDHHMLLGMQGNKGRVHAKFGKPINDEIKKMNHIKNRNQLLKQVATVIDHSIYRDYKLWSTNYIAYDLLKENNKYDAHYTNEEKLQFINYVDDRLKDFSGNDAAKMIFLKMYANPVINREGVS